MAETNFQPFVPAESKMKEFTLKAVVLGSVFGILFGAATVYLALRAGLTVSASIPIAVIAITLGRWLFKTTILENNIIQTTGSAGESVAGGVAFTLPGFLFLSAGSNGANYFDYITIFVLAIIGGILGTLMMIPLRRTLIVKEHGTLPYPEGTACAAVLKAGERGGNFAKTAFYGLGVSVVYAFFQKILHIIAEAPLWFTQFRNRYLPSANISGEITPEYLGVGYIIGPRIGGILVAGGVLSWLVLNPLLASIIQPDLIAAQLVKQGYLANVATAGGPGGWNPALHQFADTGTALYRAYIRQIGAGAVSAGGFITLLRTIPTIITSFRSSISSVDKLENSDGNASVKRTERDLNIKIVLVGSIALIVLIAVLPMIPGNTIINKALIGILVIVFGAFFVTVASRIVGLIGSSNSPISGMTIATILATSLLFIGIGWSGKVYEPMVLVVGGIICIAAANAGGTSQDLKTGFIVGATPKFQQIALFIGVIVSSIAIGITIKILDNPTQDMIQQGIHHAIGSDKFPAPQATLMATLIRGVQSGNLDWQFIFVGAFLAIVMELCGIRSLSFAVGAYLPLSTTLPIAIGGGIKGLVDYGARRKSQEKVVEEDDLGRGNLFATGLVAGGALFGVVVAFLQAFPSSASALEHVSMENNLRNVLGEAGYYILAVLFFATMAFMLYRTAKSKD